MSYLEIDSLYGFPFPSRRTFFRKFDVSNSTDSSSPSQANLRFPPYFVSWLRNTYNASPWIRLDKKIVISFAETARHFLKDEDSIVVKTISFIQKTVLNERNRQTSCKAKTTRDKEDIDVSDAKTRKDVSDWAGSLLTCLALPWEQLSDERLTYRRLWEKKKHRQIEDQLENVDVSIKTIRVRQRTHSKLRFTDFQICFCWSKLRSFCVE